MYFTTYFHEHKKERIISINKSKCNTRSINEIVNFLVRVTYFLLIPKKKKKKTLLIIIKCISFEFASRSQTRK